MTTLRTLQGLAGMIASRKATIGIFGAGYVGLPLACAFAEAGFRTVAGDSDSEKILAIQNGRVYVNDQHVMLSLPKLVSSKILEAEGDITRLASVADFAIITVPTPLSVRGEPDLSYVTGVAEVIAEKIKPGRFVILESSVYPGTTDEVVKPILEKSGLRAGEDFGLAHSPERVDYGNRDYGITNTPKVVGGITPLCTQIACELYAAVIRARIVPVSSARTAEATKMLENTYRYVNIALANELALLHEKLNIDFFEVIAAASTKPFGFQPFYPGPGVGGHCIPKDPLYLLYKARQTGETLRMVELSTEINAGMIGHVVKKLENGFRDAGKHLRGSKVAILGLAFKAGVSDTRNSPSLTLVERLVDLGVEVRVYDPFVESVATRKGILVSSHDLETAVGNADALVLITPHSSFEDIDLKKLGGHMSSKAIILDTRGFWSPAECTLAGFRYMGIGRPESS